MFRPVFCIFCLEVVAPPSQVMQPSLHGLHCFACRAAFDHGAFPSWRHDQKGGSRCWQADSSGLRKHKATAESPKCRSSARRCTSESYRWLVLGWTQRASTLDDVGLDSIYETLYRRRFLWAAVAVLRRVRCAALVQYVIDFRSNFKIPSNVNVTTFRGNLVGVRYPER